MKKEEKRRFRRHRCSITATAFVYGDKVMRTGLRITTASLGGLTLLVKKPLLAGTIIALHVNMKSLTRYVPLDNVLCDPEGHPMIRIVHVLKQKGSRAYSAGARFLEPPMIRE